MDIHKLVDRHREYENTSEDIQFIHLANFTFRISPVCGKPRFPLPVASGSHSRE